MKLPISFAILCASLYAEESTPVQPLLPLPDFHESWSDGEKQLINSFASSVNDFLSDEGIDDKQANEKYNHFREALHKLVATREIAPSFGGDTFARWAAMVDAHVTVKLFVGLGEDPHARYYIEDLELESGLVQEVIWAKHLTWPTHVFSRVELLQWLQQNGWDPAADMGLIVHALSIALKVEQFSMTEMLDWFYSLNPELTAEQKSDLYEGILVAEGGLPYLQKLVEAGELKVNEPIHDLLPLQLICSWNIFEKPVNLKHLEYLLQAGADPNLILTYEDVEDDAEYCPDGYEEDDLPRDDMDSFNTPIEIIFDRYRRELSEENTKNEANLLAAIDLLLLYGAELDIEDDECEDEDAESTAYAKVRKRLEMTPEQLRADFEQLLSAM